ncbi:MAG: inositol monophosphatase family protein [Nanoarchaeota archaeon]
MEYQELMEGLAHQAGEVIRDNFLSHGKTEYKDDTSPVTIVDTTVNRMLIERVKQRFPEHDVIGEEESDYEGDSEYTWVVDPVDGTIPYSAGIPVATFSLALVHKGVPIAGVVYDPWIDRMWYAEKGEGAYLNEKRIHVNAESDPSRMVMAVENWYYAPYQLPLYDIFKNKGIKTFVLCSIIYPSCLVASGNFSGTVFPGITCHDMAAVKIIVEEAGGKVTDLEGNEQRYDRPIKGAVVSNGVVHEMLLESISEHDI